MVNARGRTGINHLHFVFSQCSNDGSSILALIETKSHYSDQPEPRVNMKFSTSFLAVVLVVYATVLVGATTSPHHFLRGDDEENPTKLVRKLMPKGLDFDIDELCPSSLKTSCHKNGKKFHLCHMGETLCVAESALPGHLLHHPADHCGECTPAVPVLSLLSPAVTAPNPQDTSVCVGIENAEFDESMSPSLELNDVPVEQLEIQAAQVCAQVTLVDGANKIHFKVSTIDGALHELSETVFGGSASIQIDLINDDGTPFLTSAAITATLGDSGLVKETQDAVGGSAVFTNLPARTILFTAYSGDGDFSSGAAVAGLTESAQLIMVPFFDPVEELNHNFALGLAGWEMNDPNAVDLVQYEKNVGPVYQLEPTEGNRRLLFNPEASYNGVSLDTKGSTDRKHLHYTFKSGGFSLLKEIFINFVFQTSEIPGGFYGSRFNDEYTISIRSRNTGEIALEQNTMNGLGFGSFDESSGTTNEKDLLLSIAGTADDTIQIDAFVQNVGDGAYDSNLFIGPVRVTEKTEPEHPWITALKDCNKDDMCAWGKTGYPEEIEDYKERSYSEAKICHDYLQLEENKFILDRLKVMSETEFTYTDNTIYTVPLPYLLSLASKESHCGKKLFYPHRDEIKPSTNPKTYCSNGWADSSSGRCWGYGIFQLDDHYHQASIDKCEEKPDPDGGPLSLLFMEYALNHLRYCVNDVKDWFGNPDNRAQVDKDSGLYWTPMYQIKGAFTMYNAGSVKTIVGMDTTTKSAGGYYGSDLMTRAMWFYNREEYK